MSLFLQRLEAEIQRRALFPRGQKILVAVSGGVDSLVLLHALHALAPAHRWQLVVAHFNHRLRGAASDADERFVRRVAAQLRWECVSDGADVKSLASQSKISIEMAARKLRHEFLARVAREHKISRIALAHHADDQVELFFLRLLRGTGGEGLAGMKWQSPSPAATTVSLVRPLLNCFKAELRAFAAEKKIRFREDATNFSPDFLRNRIRRELLPLLRQKYQPAVDKTVLRLMDVVGAEAEFVSASAEGLCENSGGQKTRRRTVSRPIGASEWRDLPRAIQRKVLQRQLTALGLLPDFELIEDLRAVCDRPVTVTARLSVVHEGQGKLRLLDAQPLPRFSEDERTLKIAGRAWQGDFGGKEFHWQVLTRPKFSLPAKRSAAATASREFFDADSIGDTIILRHWRPGDRFQPIGMTRAVKLQDLFVNAKIPAARRRELILATTASGEIFWVEGLRIGESFKITGATKRQLRWQWTVSTQAKAGLC